MAKTTGFTRLEEAVSVGLNCVDAGIDSKETVREDILAVARENFVDVNAVRGPEDLPLSIYEMLHHAFGLVFDIRAGQIVGVGLE